MDLIIFRCTALITARGTWSVDHFLAEDLYETKHDQTDYQPPRYHHENPPEKRHTLPPFTFLFRQAILTITARVRKISQSPTRVARI